MARKSKAIDTIATQAKQAAPAFDREAEIAKVFAKPYAKLEDARERAKQAVGNLIDRMQDNVDSDRYAMPFADALTWTGDYVLRCEGEVAGWAEVVRVLDNARERAEREGDDFLELAIEAVRYAHANRSTCQIATLDCSQLTNACRTIKEENIVKAFGEVAQDLWWIECTARAASKKAAE